MNVLRRMVPVLVTGLLVVVPLLMTPAAHAEDMPPLRTPALSGLDARTYSGPIGAPGTLIRQVPLDRSVTLSDAGRAYRVLYATRDIRGRSAVSTGAVLLPRSPAPRGGYPVLAWAHGTVGLGDDCAPSVQPRIPRDVRYLGHWLRQGYAIVATDYAGLGTPGLMNYLSGKVEATSIVDSVISAHRMGVPLARRWAIVGQSQGAGAALAAARDANRLSAGHHLDYRGVVATGTPANIEQVVALAGPQLPPVALPPALNTYATYIWAGFADARPDLRPLSILTAEGRRLVRLARTTCYQDMKPLVRGKTLRDMFAAPVATIPGVRAALVDYMGTPYSGFDRPIFLGQGLRDVDVPAPSALSLYAQMRAAGQPVELHIYPDQDHSGTVIASMRDSTPFLARIMR
ncbi:Alpha/beta hydrolase family [Gordonia bronchialis]|nr:prolyl oligopeptidase family serine peptidase [Gordonia bronchialis]STQ62369.1 Alpha/beta hydrolase family [Gordonia bronchialis]